MQPTSNSGLALDTVPAPRHLPVACSQQQLAKFFLLPGPISLTVLQRFSALLGDAAAVKTTNNLQVKLRQQKQLQQQVTKKACTRFVVFQHKQNQQGSRQ